MRFGGLGTLIMLLAGSVIIFVASHVTAFLMAGVAIPRLTFWSIVVPSVMSLFLTGTFLGYLGGGFNDQEQI